MTALLVVIGAAIGAPLRYLADKAVQSRHDSVFPWGTMVVNVAGSFVLGLLVSVTLPVMALVGTGFCGALTTYSTFGYETVRLLQTGAKAMALANVLLSLGLGVGAAYLGILIGR